MLSIIYELKCSCSNTPLAAPLGLRSDNICAILLIDRLHAIRDFSSCPHDSIRIASAILKIFL